MINPSKVVKKLDPYVPGRSIEEIASNYGLDSKKIIKLGSNENPFGPSPSAVEALKKNLQQISQYPESNLNNLIKDVASYSGVSPSNVILGGDGADEILDVLGKTFIEPGDEFIVPIPGYMYYEYTLTIQGAVPVYANWDVPSNTLDVNSVIKAINPKTKLIFLCTPNNPTGGLISREDIINVLESTNAVVVVDEAYYEFSGVNNIDLLNEYKNLFILRTFSKVLGLAGMRIGYGLSNPEIIKYMYRVKPVFSLTKLSEVAATATLHDKDYIKKSTELIVESREFLFKSLSKFKNLKVYESKANYILVDVRETRFTAQELSERLIQKGIIVRDCTSFKGLDEYWIRVSVGTLDEDIEFIKILKEIIFMKIKKS
jgi:histidinol-phosphate aminotransferase